jgi:hypothetical protein
MIFSYKMLIFVSNRNFVIKLMLGWELVAHAYNPSCSEGRVKEKDNGSKQAQANSSQDSISKKSITKKGLVD